MELENAYNVGSKISSQDRPRTFIKKQEPLNRLSAISEGFGVPDGHNVDNCVTTYKLVRAHDNKDATLLCPNYISHVKRNVNVRCGAYGNALWRVKVGKKCYDEFSGKSRENMLQKRS